MSPPASPRVRILGAGVAGLAAAGLLARRGHEIEIVDKAFAVPAVGTALGMFGPAQRVLAELGLLEDVRNRAAAPGPDGSSAPTAASSRSFPPVAPC